MLPGFIKIYHRFAFFNELMHRIEKKNNLKSAQVLLLLNKLRTNIAKFEEKPNFLIFGKSQMIYTDISMKIP